MQRPLHVNWLLLVCLASATLGPSSAAAAKDDYGSMARPEPDLNPEVLRYWNTALPSSSMPDAIKKLVSPLSTLQVASYRESLQLGRLAADAQAASAFCSSAHLMCGTLNSDLAGAKLDDSSSSSSSFQTHHQDLLGDDDEPSSSSWFLESRLLAGTATAAAAVDTAAAAAPAMEVPAGRFSDRLQTATDRAFLPRELAGILRLVQRELQNILNQLHIPGASFLGDAMRSTVRLCVDAGRPHASPRGACVTSVEDMVDLVGTLLERGPSPAPSTAVEAVSSTSFPASDAALANGRFKVVKVEEKADARGRYVACHSMMFPFQVAYCHSAPRTKLYSVTLESTAVKGVTVSNVVLCHMDTSGWSPDHVAFKVLGKAPGETEACHWSGPGALAFVLAGN